jgi:hypothetical protein
MKEARMEVVEIVEVLWGILIDFTKVKKACYRGLHQDLNIETILKIISGTVL